MEQKEEDDVISNLPQHIINLILGRLPIKEVVRTSILSRKWRYRWVTIPDILVDPLCFEYYNEGEELDLLKNVNAVDRVLLHHVGPIHKFFLNLGVPFPSYHIDSWIVFLSRNGIKKLTIIAPTRGFDDDSDFYYVPSSVFNCQELRRLVLSCCIWSVPSASQGLQNLTIIGLYTCYFDFLQGFKGFPNLKELVLDKCRPFCRDDIGLSQMISKSPLLERIQITGCFIKALEIHASNLRYLKLASYCSENLSFGNCHHLVDVYIDCSIPGGFSKKALECWHRIEKLQLRASFLTALRADALPMRLCTTFYHLKYLYLEIDFTDRKSVLASLCICRSSPNLQKLEIQSLRDFFYEPEGQNSGFWDEQSLDCLFSHLQYVKMFGIVETESELEFIGYVLAVSPVLEDLSVAIMFPVESWALEKLLQFPRASPQAKINVRWNDKSVCPVQYAAYRSYGLLEY